ncbi:unnamed protein product [Malus baccata var. baccata]
MLNIFFALTKLCKRCDHGAVLQFKGIPVNSFVWVLSLVLIQLERSTENKPIGMISCQRSEDPHFIKYAISRFL